MFKHREPEELGELSLVVWYDAREIDGSEVAEARKDPAKWLPKQHSVGWLRTFKKSPAVIVTYNVCDDPSLPEEDEAFLIPKAWIVSVTPLRRARQTSPR